jgi:hypothetical protein
MPEAGYAMRHDHFLKGFSVLGMAPKRLSVKPPRINKVCRSIMPKKELTTDIPNIHFHIEPKIQCLLDVGWIVLTLWFPTVNISPMTYNDHDILLL